MTASFTIFVCSTFSDLSQEREGVLDAIRRLKLQHDSMEYFGARAEQPIETCLEEVRASNVLVVIVGHRYGSLVPELQISYSEAEYQEGFNLKKPCLVYMRDDDVPILPRHMERDPDKLKLLERWKETLRQRHTVSPFQDGGRLAVQVTADLSRTIQDLEEQTKARAIVPTEGGTPQLTEVTRVINDALRRGVPEATLLSIVRSAESSRLVTMQKREPRVFLSYAEADSAVVQRVADGLTAEGIRLSSDEETIVTTGMDWGQEIRRVWSAVNSVALFISPHSVGTATSTSRELRVVFELWKMNQGEVAVLPILLEDADVPPLMRDLQWIDLRGGEIEKGVKELVDAIRHSSPKRLMRMPQAERDALFRARPAGPIPNGEAKGTVIIEPGTRYSEAIAGGTNIFGWKGKVFDAKDGNLTNEVGLSGEGAIVARVYKGPSWLDGEECIVLDYSKPSIVASHVRDELRLIAAGFYLGKVYWDGKPLFNFCLDFRTGPAE